jgi:hypothetical protein
LNATASRTKPEPIELSERRKLTKGGNASSGWAAWTQNYPSVNSLSHADGVS